MTDTLDHTDARETLYVTDAELIRRSGVPEKIMRPLLTRWDASPGRSGFPQKNPLFGNRRCWKDVRAYLENMSRLKIVDRLNGEPR